MEMSSAEVKEYWRSYCRRRKASEKVMKLGERKIDEDPEYWADHTMGELMALVTGSEAPQ